MDIVDTVTEFVVNSEDGTEDSTTYPGQKRAIALAIAVSVILMNDSYQILSNEIICL